MVLEDRANRNLLRNVVMKAEGEKVLSKEEGGFVITLAKKFRLEVEKKTKQLYVLQGEIAQLKLNEKLIIQLVDNVISADKRAKDREKTMENLKSSKESKKKSNKK